MMTDKDGSVQRLDFTSDMSVQPWLKPLLDSYHIADKGIDKAIARARKKGRMLACAKGCSSCCKTHKDIPVFPLELVGMTWYVTEKITGPVRDKLSQRLSRHRQLDACPFLVDEVCSIHPLRPLACRHFNVFGRRCADGEDAFHTRRKDVMTPIEKYKQEALLVTLSFYGDMGIEEQISLVQSGAINRLARPMRDCHWQTLPQKMQAFDEKSGS